MSYQTTQYDERNNLELLHLSRVIGDLQGRLMYPPKKQLSLVSYKEQFFKRFNFWPLNHSALHNSNYNAKYAEIGCPSVQFDHPIT